VSFGAAAPGFSMQGLSMQIFAQGIPSSAGRQLRQLGRIPGGAGGIGIVELIVADAQVGEAQVAERAQTA
jgi:hypothetical protein